MKLCLKKHWLIYRLKRGRQHDQNPGWTEFTHLSVTMMILIFQPNLLSLLGMEGNEWSCDKYLTHSWKLLQKRGCFNTSIPPEATFKNEFNVMYCFASNPFQHRIWLHQYGLDIQLSCCCDLGYFSLDSMSNGTLSMLLCKGIRF